VGCGTCVSVCMSGGEKEVEILASELRMKIAGEGEDVQIDEITLTRQCDREYLEEVAERVADYDVLVSTACGAGVQFLAERYPDKVIFPALDTQFIGVAEAPGIWEQRCVACGECLLDKTGGICPMTICAKNLVNGPCGGTNHGKCEVEGDKDCAWTLIYNRLKGLGRLDLMTRIQPPKDYSAVVKPARRVHPAYAPDEDDEEKEK
jgi:ferredoxin